MRFYAAVINEKEEILVSFPNSEASTAYVLKDLGYTYTDMTDLICNMTEEQKTELKAMGEDKLTAPAVSLSTVKLLAPIARPRQDMICLGINYDEHASEAERYSKENFGGERPYTIYFSKRVSRATADREPIPAYTGLVDSLDYEAELGVIIGKDAKGVTREAAGEYIFGYTIVNDVSARNLQTRHKQWYLGKSLDGFTPMGPCIVTAEEIEDVQNLNIRSYVNGELRQNSNTRYMIQTVGAAIEELSAGMTLQTGTIIATGTPAGVGMGMDPPVFLKPGDTVTCEIEGIGTLTNRVEQE